MLSLRRCLVAAAIALIGVSCVYADPIVSPSVWGRCVGYAVHAGTAASFNGMQSALLTGDAGVAPGVAITGSYELTAGQAHVNDAHAIACSADKLGAFEFLMGRTCPAANKLAASDLAGVTLGPGVWCAESMQLSAARLTLDARGDADAVFLFQTATTLVTSTATGFILINGAQAKNVYWAVGSSATLATDSSFVGQISAAVSITVNSGCTVNGRLIAAAAVSFAGNGRIALPQGITVPVEYGRRR